MSAGPTCIAPRADPRGTSSEAGAPHAAAEVARAARALARQAHGRPSRPRTSDAARAPTPRWLRPASQCQTRRPASPSIPDDHPPGLVAFASEAFLLLSWQEPGPSCARLPGEGRTMTQKGQRSRPGQNRTRPVTRTAKKGAAEPLNSTNGRRGRRVSPARNNPPERRVAPQCLQSLTPRSIGATTATAHFDAKRGS